MEKCRSSPLLKRCFVWAIEELYIVFVTPTGETLEETAIREVSEEVGLEMNTLEYMGMSQAWPFPQNSLMCAFFGQVANANTQLDPENSGLKAKWFPKDVVKRAFKNSGNVVCTEDKNAELRLPPPGVIAHDMIKRWLIS
ncbi:hydrolase, NUDIX family [Trichuris suis]|nr:hydrolase, NUDIX family [Trichuris suis]